MQKRLLTWLSTFLILAGLFLPGVSLATGNGPLANVIPNPFSSASDAVSIAASIRGNG